MTRFDGRIRTFLVLSLLVIGAAWTAVSFADRVAGMQYLQTDIAYLTLPTLSFAFFFAFYATSLVVVFVSVAVPGFRKVFFSLPRHIPEPPRARAGFGGRFRALFPLTPLEWSVVVGANIGFLGLRYVLFPWPQGSDTPLYVDAANSLFLQSDLSLMLRVWGIGVGRWLTVGIIAALRALLGFAPGNPELTTIAIVPILFGIVYSLSLYGFAHLLLGDKRFAFWAGAIAPVSFLTIRLSYDLFAQFLGQALSILALGGLVAYTLSGRPQPRATGILYVLALLAHMWTWAVFAMISAGFLAWALVANPAVWRGTLRRGASVLAPSVALAVAMSIALTSIRFAALYPFSVGDARPFSFPEGWYWIGGWESMVVWGLGCFGLVAIASRRYDATAKAPLLLWTSLLSATVFVTGFDQSYRFLIMYPMPILVVVGLRYVGEHLGVPSPRTRRREEALHRAVPVAMILLLVGSVLPYTYIAEWTYWPGEAAYKELVQVRQTYGFGNRSVLILIEPRYFETGLLWASAVTGAEVYPGNLISLLRGDPYRREIHVWIRPDLTGVREVLLPSTLYLPDAYEKPLLSPGTVTSVPVYRVDRGFNVSTFFSDAQLPLATSFWADWYLSSATLGYRFFSTNAHVLWTFEPQPVAASVSRWVALARPLPSEPMGALYILASGGLGGASGEITVFYADNSTTSLALDRVSPEPTLSRIRLDPGRAPARLQIIFWVDAGRTSGAGWFAVDFMALVAA